MLPMENARRKLALAAPCCRRAMTFAVRWTNGRNAKAAARRRSARRTAAMGHLQQRPKLFRFQWLQRSREHLPVRHLDIGQCCPSWCARAKAARRAGVVKPVAAIRRDPARDRRLARHESGARGYRYRMRPDPRADHRQGFRRGSVAEGVSRPA